MSSWIRFSGWPVWSDQDLVQPLPRPQEFPGVNIDIGRLPSKPLHPRLVDEDPRIGQENRLPFAPAASSTAATEAAWPMQ